jgi:hypothetical protein
VSNIVESTSSPTHQFSVFRVNLLFIRLYLYTLSLSLSRVPKVRLSFLLRFANSEREQSPSLFETKLTRIITYNKHHSRETTKPPDGRQNSHRHYYAAENKNTPSPIPTPLLCRSEAVLCVRGQVTWHSSPAMTKRTGDQIRETLKRKQSKKKSSVNILESQGITAKHSEPSCFGDGMLTSPYERPA